jgi:surface polysaccharide O-acyltransferase-like enzyme
MKDTKLTQRASSLLLLAILCSVATTTLLAQTRGEVSVRSYALVSPVVALIAGILILIVPRLLNYIVALYLIVIGLIGIFGR